MKGDEHEARRGYMNTHVYVIFTPLRPSVTSPVWGGVLHATVLR
jgi:hypothetical protein